MNHDQGDITAHIMSFASSPARLEMVVRAGQALELTDALWDLVPLVAAAGEQHDHATPEQVADASPAGGRLSDDVRRRVRQAARQWSDGANAALDTAWDDSSIPSLTPADVMADPLGTARSFFDLPAVAAEMLRTLGAGLSSMDEFLYYFSYLRADRRPRRTTLLLRALYATAVATLEPLATRMIQLLLHHTKPHLYPSLADPALDKKARELCFGPPKRWRETFVDEFGVTAITDAVDWGRLDRLWEDRNAISHRAGIIDARHSAKSGAEVGTVLSPEPDDVRAVIDEIGAARYGIVTAIWDRLDPGAGSTLAEQTWPALWESLRSGRWRLAEGLGRVQEAFATNPESRATAKVHRWLAVDRGLGAEAIREQVEEWDVSELPSPFKVARHVLLREDERALQLLRDLITTGSITEDDMDTWPIFDRLRDEGRLTDLWKTAN